MAGAAGSVPRPQQLIVEGPDGRTFRFNEVPGPTTLGALGRELLDQYPEGVLGRDHPMVIERVNPDGSTERVNPGNTVEQESIPEGARIRVGFEASARCRFPYSGESAEPPDVPVAAARPARTRPLRVLVIGASPWGLPPVRADRESRAIAKAAVAGRLDVDAVPGAEATDLEAVRSFRPDILHLVCHGDEDCLVFNDVRGESDPVKAGRIADTLRFYQRSAGVRLRAIVLAACDGQTLAPLLADVADTVIAHRGTLSDPCGVAFATQLYRRLNEIDDLAAAAYEAAQLSAQFSAACDSVIDNLIVIPGQGLAGRPALAPAATCRSCR